MIRPEDPAPVRPAVTPCPDDVEDLIRIALTGWCTAPLAGFKALMDRWEARP